MAQITITEALSEINLIKKKIAKKKETILGCLVRPSHLPDPFEKDGGSKDFVANETRAIEDLIKRWVKIRSSIAKANVEYMITIDGKSQSIYDWLTFKREIADDMIAFSNQIVGHLNAHSNRAANQPQVYKTDDGKTELVKYSVSVEQADWIRQNEMFTQQKEKVDGQLSLKNATIVIDI